MVLRLIIPLLLVVSCLPPPVAGAGDAVASPRLILFITVDQLRGDMPGRFARRFGAGGFTDLMQRGTHWTNAHYRHATTFTSVGHASLFTGGSPTDHGIVGNEWFDSATQYVYSAEDARYQLLGAVTEPNQGTGPALLTSSTIGDELITATGGAAKVLAISVKDRGAIIPAGHLGDAVWFSKVNGRFVTSTAYYDQEPAWLTQFNASGVVDEWRDGVWDLLRPIDTYELARRDDRPFEMGYGSLGHTFPHPITDGERPYAYTLCYTPMSDELLSRLAQAAIVDEQLGMDDVPDLLSISFSATDYIGHAFGPHSLEAEDNLLRLDATLARLFAWIDTRVGLDRTIIVLSSDHGVDASPEYHYQLECELSESVGSRLQRVADDRLLLGPAAGRHDHDCGRVGRHYPADFMIGANTFLRETFRIEDDLVAAFVNPCVYLDAAKTTALGLEIEPVERALARFLGAMPGMAHAIPRTDLMTGRVPDTPLMQRVQRSFHPERSGHVFLVQKPFWFLNTVPTAHSAMHGSPYWYDTHVPIIIAGPGLPRGHVHRRVGPEDIAPTLALILNIPAPSGCTGDILLDATSEPLGR